MSTSKRRLMLSVSPELDKAIERLANAQGRPRATVVVEILEDIAPQLEQLAQAYELSKSAPQQAMQRLFGTLFNAISKGALIGQEMISESDKEAIHD